MLVQLGQMFAVFAELGPNADNIGQNCPMLSRSSAAVFELLFGNFGSARFLAVPSGRVPERTALSAIWRGALACGKRWSFGAASRGAPTRASTGLDIGVCTCNVSRFITRSESLLYTPSTAACALNFSLTSPSTWKKSHGDTFQVTHPTSRTVSEHVFFHIFTASQVTHTHNLHEPRTPFVRRVPPGLSNNITYTSRPVW